MTTYLSAEYGVLPGTGLLSHLSTLLAPNLDSATTTAALRRQLDCRRLKGGRSKRQAAIPQNTGEMKPLIT